MWTPLTPEPDIPGGPLRGNTSILTATVAHAADASKVATSTKHTRSALFINRDFAVLWAGQALSIVGNTVFSTT